MEILHCIFQGDGFAAELPNVAYLHRQKPLRSRDSPAFGGTAVLASDRTSRTVKYASTCPSLCAATSEALLRVFSSGAGMQR